MALYGWDSWDNEFNHLNRLFDNFTKDLNTTRRGDGSGRVSRRRWYPPIDVYENEKEFTVHAELPVRQFFFIFYLYTSYFVYLNQIFQILGAY